MTNSMKAALAVLIASCGMISSTGANAAVIVTISQDGTNVVATTSGSLNLTGLTSQGPYLFGPEIRSSAGYFATGIANLITGYTGLLGATNIGTNSDIILATVSRGVSFGINEISFGVPYVFVPTNYVSGASLNGTATFTNQTFASLGLVTGSSTFRSSADSVTVNIGAMAAAVPEPASWLMMILGMGAIGFAMRRRVRASEVRFNAKIKQISEGAAA